MVVGFVGLCHEGTGLCGIFSVSGDRMGGDSVLSMDA